MLIIVINKYAVTIETYSYICRILFFLDLSNLHLHLYQKYGPIFKMWMGSNLIIVVSKPKYIESVLTKFVEKKVNFSNVLIGNGLLTIAPGINRLY